MKIIFTIPTMFRTEKQEIIKKCFNKLHHQCELNKINYKIILICNSENINFKNWKIDSKNVIKKFSNIKFNISVSLNIAINQILDEDYFCFFHDDIMIYDDFWIQNFIKIYEIKKLNCGVLGIRAHYQGRSLIKRYPFFKRLDFKKKFKYEIQEHTFVDGIMFISSDIIKAVGKFDENYFGDCESEDYNYRIKEFGHKNYRVVVDSKHYSNRFGTKVNSKDNNEFLNLVKKSRLYRKEKWGNRRDITKGLVDL